MKLLMTLTLGAILLAVGCDNNSRTDRDNTAVNERDADGMTKTPFDQSNAQSDIDLVATLRREVLEIEDLSVNGGNIKIITNNGQVVLRGPVDSASERDAIENVVKNIAGAENVSSELEVETD